MKTFTSAVCCSENYNESFMFFGAAFLGILQKKIINDFDLSQFKHINTWQSVKYDNLFSNFYLLNEREFAQLKY